MILTRLIGPFGLSLGYMKRLISDLSVEVTRNAWYWLCLFLPWSGDMTELVRVDYIIHVTRSTRLGHLGLKEQERERGREGERERGVEGWRGKVVERDKKGRAMILASTYTLHYMHLGGGAPSKKKSLHVYYYSFLLLKKTRTLILFAHPYRNTTEIHNTFRQNIWCMHYKYICVSVL